MHRDSERKQQLWNSGYVLSVDRRTLLTNGCVNHVRTKIILWWKGHITKTATCKGVLPAAAPHCSAVLGHFRCDSPSPSHASEMLLKSLKLKNSEWVQKGILKSVSSIKEAYVRIVFILAHRVLKCNLQNKENKNKYRIWLIQLRKSRMVLVHWHGNRWGESIPAKQKKHTTPGMYVFPHESRDVFQYATIPFQAKNKHTHAIIPNCIR